MDDAPAAGDLDLDAVSSRDDLAARLRKVHLLADRPSLRTLESMTRHSATPLSKTAVAEMLKAVRLPRKAVMVAFLQACGVQEDDLESWRRAWERAALGEAGAARPGIARAGPSRKDQGGAVARHIPHAVRAAGDETQVQRSDAARQWEARRESQPGGTTRSEEAHGPRPRQSMWHFPDGSRVTLVSYRMPPDRRPPSADPGDPNYVRLAGLADLDTLIEVYGAIRAYNPTSRVAILAAQDLIQPDVATHLVLIGGLTWEAVTPWFSRIFPIPIEAGDPFDRGAIVVRDPGGGEREFTHTVIDDEIVEDVGFFACGENPSAPRRTLTICGGITTRGVRGAARCFIDWEMRERNEQYLLSRFPSGSAYCVVMRVPIINRDPLTPDLSKRENRLFEWCDMDTATG